MKKILVIGSGGREHAIVKALKQSPQVAELFVAPGNGGIAQEATCVSIQACDVAGVTAFCLEQHIDFVVVTPDDPLVFGMVDALTAIGISCFGPNKRAAEIEGSKAFAKQLMTSAGIPTAGYAVFTDPEQAIDYLTTKADFPIVIKADGLALGKGVIIAANLAEATLAVRKMLVDGAFGTSGKRIVIEEYLTGPEVSVLTFCDGKTIVPMISSMDHKRALDGDGGLNTGGMGVIAPNPYYTPDLAARCMDEIFRPTIEALSAADRPFSGCLYFGLMLTSAGPKVIEYNCRFGDPETQAILPLLESDLLTIFEAVSAGRLAEVPVSFAAEKHAACVILASGGYPLHYEVGYPISGLASDGQLATPTSDAAVCVYHAGTTCRDGVFLTSGGRVLGVTAVAPSLETAIAAAYQAVEQIDFPNRHRRLDIGASALAHF